MKKTTLWSMLMLTILMLPIFSACGDDGDGSSNSDNIKAQLVGIWKTSMSSSNWKYIKLESNGTLIYAESINNLRKIIGYASIYEKAFWSYNGSDNTISMYTDDGYYAFTYKVNMAADGKSWAGYTTNNNSKTYTFIKVENIDDNDITETPSGNDDDINTDEAYTLEGTWTGYIDTYIRDRYGLSGDSYRTTMYFERENSYGGRGNEVDYNIYSRYNDYYYCEFAWEVVNGNIRINYADSWNTVYIYDYSLTSNHFRGYMDDGKTRGIYFDMTYDSRFDWSYWKSGNTRGTGNTLHTSGEFANVDKAH